MSHIYAVLLDKGGVGKTTTALNIAGGLSKKGHKVLLIDVDPQAHMSSILGYTLDKNPTLYNLIVEYITMGAADYGKYIHHNDAYHADFIPVTLNITTIDTLLAQAETQLENGKMILHQLLRESFFQQYDFIILDCPTSIDRMFVTHSIRSADKIIVPVQAHVRAYENIPLTLSRVSMIKHGRLDAPLSDYVAGFLVTQYNASTKMSKEIHQSLTETFGDLVFDQPVNMLQEIPESTRTKECLVYKQGSRTGAVYSSFVETILERERI